MGKSSLCRVNIRVAPDTARVESEMVETLDCLMSMSGTMEPAQAASMTIAMVGRLSVPPFLRMIASPASIPATKCVFAVIGGHFPIRNWNFFRTAGETRARNSSSVISSLPAIFLASFATIQFQLIMPVSL